MSTRHLVTICLIVSWTLPGQAQMMKITHRLGGATLLAPNKVKTVAFAPDGKTIASGGGDESTAVLLWSPDTGRVVGRLQGASMQPTGLAFSADGRRLAAIDIGSQVLVFNVAARTLEATLSTGGSSAYHVGISADGGRVAVADSNGRILEWNLDRPDARREIGAVEGPNQLLYTRAGSLIVASDDGLWQHSASGWEKLSTGKIKRVALDDKGHIAATAEYGDQRSIVLHDGATRKRVAAQSNIYGLRVLPSSQSVVSADNGGRVVVWDRKSTKSTLEIDSGTVLWSMDVSPDGTRVVAAGRSPRVHLWTLPSGKPALAPSAHRSAIARIDFSPDGKQLASADTEGHIVLWNPQTGAMIQALPKRSERIDTLRYSPDGKALLVSSGGTTQLLDPRIGAPTGASFSTAGGDALHWTPDGNGIVRTDSTRIAVLIDALTGRTLRTFGASLPNDEVRQNLLNPSSIAMSPDGKSMAMGRWDQPVYVYEIATGRKVRSIDGILDVTWSPDGRMIGAGIGRFGKRVNTLKQGLFDAKTGKLLQSFDIQPGAPFTRDGRNLVTWSTAGVSLVSIATGKTTQTPSPGHAPSCLAISPDGVLMATGARDATILVWSLQ